MAKRSLTARNVLDKIVGKVVDIQDENLRAVIGPAEQRGCWLIYGKEKNGKTWLSLRLAKDLAYATKVAYVSAEEGMDKSFQDAVKRAGITRSDKILFDEYMPLDDILLKFKKPKTANIIFIDNMTIYNDEFRDIKVKKFIDSMPSKLIVFVAHEERKEPYPTAAKMASKWAKVKVRVIGLRAHVEGRFSGGGTFDIDPEKCTMYWGNND